MKDMAFKLIYEMNSKGMEYAHTQWTAWKKADAEATLKGIAGSDESLVDIQSLKAIVFDPNKNYNVSSDFTAVPGDSEFYDLYISENESYLLGAQSLDKTMDNLRKKGDEILSKAKANQ